MHCCEDLILLFNELFANTEHTILVGGGKEPIYLPKNEQSAVHQIIFTQDYFASALHEIAHWCIAGTERRQLMDYGYWYQPDGRSDTEQSLFEQVEAKPQALEWIFSMAARAPFRVSIDNLSNIPHNIDRFKQSIHQQTITYLHQGLPKRAQRFMETLLTFYSTDQKLNLHHFRYELL